MKSICALTAGFLLAAARAGAVYAPIPEAEQGKALTLYLSGGVMYDTNIFGSAFNETDSLVYQFQPSLVFNASVATRSFATVTYRPSLDYVPDRPGTKALDSHTFSARLAHTMSPLTEFDLNNTYELSKNPESLLPGVGTLLNTDQSYRRNQLDARFATGLTRRTGLTAKVRHAVFQYEDDLLARELDRRDLLLGLAASHKILPEIQALAEYRYQRIDYGTDGIGKDKDSHFLLAGTDYILSKQTGFSARLGLERRSRDRERGDTTPYAELGFKYDYGRGSYVAAGYSFSTEETSNLELYTDITINRFFVNLQQTLTPKAVATASVTWEPSTLRGRSGISPDRSETNVRAGAALVYRAGPAWSVSVSLDHDDVTSDDPNRALKRTRMGVTARYVF